MALRRAVLGLVVITVVVISTSVLALDNGQALTPQMGWNSWNLYGCTIDQDLIINTAKAMVSTGLSSYGYNYVNIDDCWGASARDAQGRLQSNPSTFPNGILYVSNAVHSLGLKFGIYSDAGNRTCQNVQPGSLGYESIDAQTFASWGVDYLKYDNCNNDNIPPKQRYPPMRDALNATGRPILYSMCEWGEDRPATWAGPVGNSWRTTGDISDHWDSMLSNLDHNNKWASYAGPGAWNDPDMLEVGNGGMTDVEYQSHFSLWCLVKAPLIIGTNVMNMSSSTFSILTNSEAIAVNQDSLGVQGRLVSTTVNRSQQVWAGPLSGGRYAAILFNRGSSSANITIHFADIGWASTTTASIRDLWLHQTVGSYTGSYSATVQSHGVVFIILTPSSFKNHK